MCGRVTQQLRSMSHVRTYKERHHPHPTPPHPPNSCVACHMCARVTQQLRSMPHVCKSHATVGKACQPTCHMCARDTQQLRSMSRVCTCKERHHPHTPPHPQPTRKSSRRNLGPSKPLILTSWDIQVLQLCIISFAAAMLEPFIALEPSELNSLSHIKKQGFPP